MGDKLQIAKRPGESHKHNPHLRVGKLPYLMGDKLEIVKNPGESRKHNPHLRVGKLPQLSEFLTSGDLPVGDKLLIAKRPGESHKHNPRLMVGKLPQLSKFLTSGDPSGANINFSWAICFKLPKDQGKAINIIQG
eukprot:CCRYP_015539-RG/>CCRYP_015539-RG protein AED:0.35 eAED:0.39 QI:15/0.6/0.66/1/0/0/6/83/134